MKFLVKISLVIFFLFNIVLCSECLECWITKNLNTENKIIYLDLNVNKEKISIYYNKDNIKISTNSYILVSNNKKTSKYIFDKNQLFIDFPDKKFNNYISKFFDLKKITRKFKSMGDNNYYLRKINNIDKMNLYFNDECTKLDSVVVKDKDFYLKIDSIQTNYLLTTSVDSLFTINYLNNDVIKYDFRYEK
tara:strand:- start:175 stop:747 length:573 start_codon:yes stop_codon:yes gene_type:complete